MVKYILGVKIDDLSFNEIISLVSSWMCDTKKRMIVTPNPEFVMVAQKDSDFKEVLNRADLNIPDGHGLRLAGIDNTVTGVDLMTALCQKAALEHWRVGFFGGRDGSGKLAAESLQKKFPGLRVSFIEEGGEVLISGASTFEVSLLPESDIVFVALGQVKQERWIIEHMNKIHAKIFMGVGGAFDYLSGHVPRAPKLIRSLGLEWLFRLIIQPWRLKRQLVLIEFVWKVLFGSAKT